MARRLPALEAEAKTVKAMKTPAAKAKGMKPKTQPLAGMKTPAAKAKEMKPDRQTEIIIEGLIRLTSPRTPCEILRCLLDDPVPNVSSISTTTESSRCAIIERARRLQDQASEALAFAAAAAAAAGAPAPEPTSERVE